MSHTKLLVVGLIVLIVADVILAVSNHWGIVLLGVALWGLHMGMTQGLLTAMIAGASPADLRGTAYGFFNLACGLALLAASTLAGIVWEQFGAPFTFYVGATCGACAIALIVLKMDRPRS
jgi:predicted MFS family arabinose efflux permease